MKKQNVFRRRWIIKKQTVLEALTWTKFNKINSSVTKAQDIVWDAVVRVYTQLLINSPSWPTNSYKSVMGEGVVDVDSMWLTMMPTNRQLHHLTLSFSSLHVRNCSSLGKRLLTLQEEEFPPQYEEKYSQPCCCAAILRHEYIHITRAKRLYVWSITRAKRASFTRPFSVSPQSRSPISVSLQPTAPSKTTWIRKNTDCFAKTKNAMLTYDRRIFVYSFCLINICSSLSDEANNN